MVIPNLHGGGAERVVSRLSQEWAKTHQVVAAVLRGIMQQLAGLGISEGQLTFIANPSPAVAYSKREQAFAKRRTRNAPVNETLPPPQ